MKNIFSILAFAIFGVMLGGCSQSKVIPQEGIFVVWKSPAMKYADQGFLYHEKGRLRLEVYASGQPALKLTVTPGQVCSGALCMRAKAFNRRYLSADYPEDTLQRILAGEPIFSGEGRSESQAGFTQKIEKRGDYAIDYSVLNGSIVFRDTINHIMIKIQKEST